MLKAENPGILQILELYLSEITGKGPSSHNSIYCNFQSREMLNEASISKQWASPGGLGTGVPWDYVEGMCQS